MSSLSPKEISTPPILILLFANFPFAIEPANIAFVTVPYCKVPVESTCNTVLTLPLPNLANVVAPVAYRISPAVYDVIFVPPLPTGTVPPVISWPLRPK